jgi:HK97 family phage portal protein
MPVASWLTPFLRGVIEPFRAARPAPPPANELDAVSSYMIGRPLPEPTGIDRRNLIDEGYRKNVIVYICVNEIASTAAAPKLKLRTRSGDEIETHPMLDVLARPNPQQGRYDLLSTTLIHMLSAGDAYWHKGRTGGGNVVQLKALRPTRMSPIIDSKGNVVEYEHVLESQTSGDRVPAEDVVSFRLFDPLNDFHGLPPVAVCAVFGDIDTEAALYMRDFFLNGAMPGGLLKLKVPRVKPAERDRIWREWQDQFGRQDAGDSRRLTRWHSIGVIGADVEYEQVSKEPAALGLDGIWGMSESRICATYGVPPIIVGTRIGLEKATYSNYETAQRAFWIETLAPMYQRLADTITRHLATEWGEDLELYFDLEQIPALQENETERIGRIRDSYRSGLRTLNESRRLLGEEEVDIDYIVVPKNAKRFEVAMDPNPPVPPPSPFGPQPGPGPDEDDDDDDTDDDDEGQSGSGPEILHPGEPPDGAEQLVSSQAATMRAALNAIVVQTREAVDLGSLRTALEQKTREGAEAAVPIALFERRYAEELEQHLVRVAERGARLHFQFHAGQDLETHALKDLPRKVRDAILSRVRLETRRVTREVRHVVRSEILRIIKGEAEAIDPGTIVDSIGLSERQATQVRNLRARMTKAESTAKQIDRATAKLRRKLIRDRAALIAEHETRVAEKFGQRAAWERLFKERKLRRRQWHKMWLTAEDERVCPICEPLDRVEVPVNKLFDDQWEAPPDPHARCRCRVVLVKARKGFRTEEVD